MEVQIIGSYAVQWGKVPSQDMVMPLVLPGPHDDPLAPLDPADVADAHLPREAHGRAGPCGSRAGAEARLAA